jgi:hypothetical protein
VDPVLAATTHSVRSVRGARRPSELAAPKRQQRQQVEQQQQGEAVPHLQMGRRTGRPSLGAEGWECGARTPACQWRRQRWRRGWGTATTTLRSSSCGALSRHRCRQQRWGLLGCAGAHPLLHLAGQNHGLTHRHQQGCAGAAGHTRRRKKCWLQLRAGLTDQGLPGAAPAGAAPQTAALRLPPAVLQQHLANPALPVPQGK